MSDRNNIRFCVFIALLLLSFFCVCNNAFAADSSPLDALVDLGNYLLTGLGNFLNDIGTAQVATVTKLIEGERCLTCSEFLFQNLSVCRFCDVFENFFDVINDLSYAIYENSRIGFTMILAVCLALWIAFQVGVHISSFVPQSPEEFWTFMSRTFFKAIVVAVFLQLNIGHFVGWFMSPFVVGASEFSEVVVESFGNMSTSEDYRKRIGQFAGVEPKFQTFGEAPAITGVPSGVKPLSPEELQAKIDEANALKTMTNTAVGVATVNPGIMLMLTPTLVFGAGYGVNKWIDSSVMELYQNQSAAHLTKVAEFNPLGTCLDREMELLEKKRLSQTKEEKDSATENGALTPEIRISLKCMIKNINEEIAFGLSVADAIMCHSKGMHGWGPITFADIPTFLAGALLWICCFLLGLIFTFKLIDACFRLGVLYCLLPLLMIVWVFPSTKAYAKQGLSSFVQILTIFMTMAVVLALAILLVMQAFQADLYTNVAPDYEIQPNVMDSKGLSQQEIQDKYIRDKTGMNLYPDSSTSVVERMSNKTIITRADEQVDIRTLFYKNDVEGIVKNFNLSGTAFLVAIVCFFFALLITGVIDSLASEFSGVSFGTVVGDRVSSGMSRAVASVAVGAATIAAISGKKMMSKPKGSSSTKDQGDGGG